MLCRSHSKKVYMIAKADVASIGEGSENENTLLSSQLAESGG